MTELGLSQPQVAQRGGISKQVVQQILDPDRSHTPEYPRRRTLEGLAGALTLDMDVVLEAAQRDAGMWVERMDMADGESAVLAAVREVPGAAQDQVLAMIRNFSQALKAVGDGNSKPKQLPQGGRLNPRKGKT